MASIKTKLLVYFGALLIVICSGLGFISYCMASNSLVSNAEDVLPQFAAAAAKVVESRVDGQLNTLEAVANMDRIKDLNSGIESKLAILAQESQRNGHIKMGIADLDGNYKTTKGENLNIKDRAHFKNALAGERYISDPIVSKTDNSMIVTIAVPIRSQDKIIGVLVAVRDGNELSEIVKDITFSKTGKAFMINSTGTVIAHDDQSMVFNMYNAIEASKEDQSLLSLASLEQRMIQREGGVDIYDEGGVQKYLGFAPITGTNWSLGISVEQKDVLSGLEYVIGFSLGSSLIFLFVALILVFLLARNITNSLAETVTHLSAISTGNLKVEVSKKFLTRKDEVGVLARSIETMQNSFGGMVKVIKEVCKQIEDESQGLSDASEQMTSLAQNVTGVIQNIAQGTDAQANDMSQISEVIDEFSKQLDLVVTSIEEIESYSTKTNEMANQSNANMTNMIDTVSRLRDGFESFSKKILGFGHNVNQINEITNLINSIADQTDLLALNAAIEAARAGDAGRGFAVVADEIRKLAEQSKDSSANISTLVNAISADTETIVHSANSMNHDLNKQLDVINITIDSFQKIIQSIGEMGPKIEAVNESAEMLNSEKDIILEKIEGAASVAQEVSASTEEIAASSEEMSASTENVASTANTLNNMTKEMMIQVEKFKI